MQICIVCEKPVIESALKNVYYCNNVRCTRLGVLTVFVLVPNKEEPKEEIKDDKDLPKPGIR